jgi:hypothetical protein
VQLTAITPVVGAHLLTTCYLLPMLRDDDSTDVRVLFTLCGRRCWHMFKCSQSFHVAGRRKRR